MKTVTTNSNPEDLEDDERSLITLSKKLWSQMKADAALIHQSRAYVARRIIERFYEEGGTVYDLLPRPPAQPNLHITDVAASTGNTTNGTNRRPTKRLQQDIDENVEDARQREAKRRKNQEGKNKE